ncbi:Na+/H+ antiporter subunit E [Xanthobacter sediminis]
MTMGAGSQAIPRPAARPTPVQCTVRSAWFFLAWIALGRVGGADLVAGLAVSILAGQLSLRLVPPAARGPDVPALGRFALHFVRRSGAAGLEMARRVFHPALPLAPGVLAVECGLPPGLARQAFAATVSLQPGALPVGEEEEALLFHVLDLDAPVLEGLEEDLAVFLDALGAPGEPLDGPAGEDGDG